MPKYVVRAVQHLVVDLEVGAEDEESIHKGEYDILFTDVIDEYQDTEILEVRWVGTFLGEPA